MTFHFRWCAKALAGVAVVSLIAACSSDLTGSNRHLVQLSFTTNATAGPAGNLVAGDLAVGAADELVLQSVQLVFRKIELDRAGTAECIDDEGGDDDDDNRGPGHGDDDDGDRGRRHGDDHDCEEVLRDPTLVNVPVDGTLQPIIEIPLTDGTFSELEAKLAPAKASETAFNTANPDLVGKSVRVVGLFNGEPFVFTSRVRAKLEMEFDPPLVINDATRNATVSIDVREWFLNSSGGVIDPRVSGEGTNNLRRIENNIRRSFRAFEDNDRHGDDDHGRHHGDDDGGHG